jgi:hypothetical protein
MGHLAEADCQLPSRCFAILCNPIRYAYRKRLASVNQVYNYKNVQQSLVPFGKKLRCHYFCPTCSSNYEIKPFQTACYSYK